MSVTRDLLLRWHGGDQNALAALVEQDLEWIEARVRQRLGPLLRKRQDTQDIVQMTLMEVMRYGPRFLISDRNHFRAILARMVENTLRGQADHDRAARRDARREAALPSREGVVTLDVPASNTQPSDAAARHEMQTWVRLGLELLDPEDRNVILWREYQDLSFADIAERLGVGENGARMRFNRALPKLAKKLEQLQAGRMQEALEEHEESR